MADTDQPLAHLAEVEQQIPEPEVKHDPEPEVKAEPEPVELTAEQRLRAFEDQALGKDTPRINGHVERGIGSRFSRMDDEDKAHHNALVELIAAEKACTEAGAALTAAKARHEAAIQRAADTEPKG